MIISQSSNNALDFKVIFWSHPGFYLICVWSTGYSCIVYRFKLNYKKTITKLINGLVYRWIHIPCTALQTSSSNVLKFPRPFVNLLLQRMGEGSSSRGRQTHNAKQNLCRSDSNINRFDFQRKPSINENICVISELWIMTYDISLNDELFARPFLYCRSNFM